jgi:hypothetical protein
MMVDRTEGFIYRIWEVEFFYPNILLSLLRLLRRVE